MNDQPVACCCSGCPHERNCRCACEICKAETSLSAIPFPLYVLHQFSGHHRGLLERPEVTHVGCFYCRQVYPKGEIRDWTDAPREYAAGNTAICPKCGIDAVLPDMAYHGWSSFPELLTVMQEAWFE